MAIRVTVWYGDFSWKVKSIFFNSAQNNKPLRLQGLYRLQMLHQPRWVRSREKLRPKITPWYNGYLQRSLTRVAVSRETAGPRVYAGTHTWICTDARARACLSGRLCNCDRVLKIFRDQNCLITCSDGLIHCLDAPLVITISIRIIVAVIMPLFLLNNQEFQTQMYRNSQYEHNFAPYQCSFYSIFHSYFTSEDYSSQWVSTRLYLVTLSASVFNAQSFSCDICMIMKL